MNNIDLTGLCIEQESAYNMNGRLLYIIQGQEVLVIGKTLLQLIDSIIEEMRRLMIMMPAHRADDTLSSQPSPSHDTHTSYADAG